MRFSSFCCIFLVQLKSATYQSIGSSLGFFILLGALFYSRKKNYLPQFWSPCFVVLPLLLVRLYLFKIRRGICIVCNTKAVGCARACICISNISLFTGLELKLKSFRLAANIASLFCWSFFLKKIIHQTFLCSSIFCCDMIFTLLQSSMFSWWIMLPCITVNIVRCNNFHAWSFVWNNKRADCRA